MRVIFTQDIPGVARRDQVREVSDGYAVNFLLPKGLAVKVTPERILAVAAKAKAEEQLAIKNQKQAENWSNQLRGRAVTILASASSEGTLYAGITATMLAQAINSQLKVPVMPNQIVLSQGLKKIGKWPVELKLWEDITATITVVVETEKKRG